MTISQENYSASIKISSMGDNDILFIKAAIKESLDNQCYIEALTAIQSDSLEITEIIGKEVTITWNVSADYKRYFSGHIFHAEQIDNRNRKFPKLKLVIYQWVHFLNYASDCQVYLDKKAPDIMEDILKDVYPSGNYEFKLSRTYSERPLCIQYNETSFNFIKRLMETEGMYFYFRHEDGKHTLIITDDRTKHTSISKYDSIPYLKNTRKDHQIISSINRNVSFCSSSYSTNCFDFQNPNDDNKSEKSSTLNLTPSCKLYKNLAYSEIDGNTSDYADLGQERAESKNLTYSGMSNAGGLATGYTFSMTDNPDSKLNKTYLVTEISLKLLNKSTADTDFFKFKAIENSAQFRPKITIPNQIIPSQTATVKEVGKSENLGMVKVKFHWDSNNSETNTSCWIRVGQLTADNSWGCFFIPTVDQEVIVHFIDGTPALPVVSHALYNGHNAIPDDFKDAEKYSGFITQDSCNKLIFQDDSDDKTKSKISLFSEGDQDLNITGNSTEQYGKKLDTSIGDDGYTLSVSGKTTHTYSDDVETKYEGSEKVTVTNDSKIEISGKKEETVSKDLSLTVSGKLDQKASKDCTIQGKNIEIKGNQKIKQAVSSSTQEISSTGVELKGTKLELKANSNLNLSGSLATLKASGILTLKGSMAKIN